MDQAADPLVPLDPFGEIAARIEAAIARAPLVGASSTVSNVPEEEIVCDTTEIPIRRAEKVPGAESTPTGGGARIKTGKRRRPPQRDSLIGLGEDCEFWLGTDQETYATYKNDRGVIEHALIFSREFKQHLSLRAYNTTGEVPGSTALDDVLRVFAAKAWSGPVHEPILRTGAGPNGTIVIDHCDATGAYTEIGPHGFQTLRDGRPKFIRKRAMTALREPEPGSSIRLLRPFLNVETEAGFVLVVGWLLMALRPSGPFPILVFSGEQGSGKSSVSTLLRRITDPSAVPISAPPKDIRDLIINAINARVMCLDNLSRVDPEVSDALCRLSTGGGARTRMLHTNSDEMVLMGSRPQIINGIGHLAERADLADRTVGVGLAAISDKARRSEHDFWRDFETVEPAIVGALFTAVSHGLRDFEKTRMDRSPRLADFARWVVACEPGLGEDWAAGTFMQAYGANRSDVQSAAFESDPVAMGIDSYIRDVRPSGWSGTASELLAALNTTVAEEVRRRRNWPISPQGLGNALDRAAPLLRARGINIERRHSGKRFLVITLRSNTGDQP